MKYVKGDVFESGADAILHQVNCQGVMGGGIAKQVKDKYPRVFESYKFICDSDKILRLWKYGNEYDGKSLLLGNAQICHTYGGKGDAPLIVNLFAQFDFGYGECHTDYDALRKCLEDVNYKLAGKKIAIPYKMSCGLAGGDWNIVSKMIEETLTDCDVTIYEYTPSYE